jgi:ribulose-5-phosphate 4-epimerase/fuculose-1-phosphate aldolase
MVNITATLSTLITANHILHHLNVLDAMGHISVRNPSNASTFYIALQLGPAVVSSPQDIGEYLVEDGSPVNGTQGGYAERYIHSEILRAYPDVNSVVHSHAEDVLPFTLLPDGLEASYHMAGFLGACPILFLPKLSLLHIHPSYHYSNTEPRVSTEHRLSWHPSWQNPGTSTPNFDIQTAYTADDPQDMLINSPRLGAALASAFGTNASQPTSPLYSTVLQRGHGFVTTGSSIEQAVDFAYYATSNARVQRNAMLLSAAMGETGNANSNGTENAPKWLSAQERTDCANMNRWIVFKPWRQWVVEVERSGMYVNDLGTPPLTSS